MGFDRFMVCLGYWHYAVCGYKRYEEQCDILGRLEAIGFRPAQSWESIDLDEPPSYDAGEDFTVAYDVYQKLVEEGYEVRS